MKRLFKKCGMSFLEITVSIAIFSVIIASIFTALFTGRLYWRVGTSQLDVQQQARQAISFIVKELRQTRAAILQGLPDDGDPHSSVTFEIPQDTSDPPDGIVVDANGQIVEWSKEITYCLVNNQIIRLEQETSSPCVCVAPYTDCKVKVLANNVNSLQFTRTSRFIKVIVTTRKNIAGSNEPIEYTVRSSVRLRN